MEKEYAQSWNELWNYDTNKITGHNRVDGSARN